MGLSRSPRPSKRRIPAVFGHQEILLPDHVGGRIARELTGLGLKVVPLKDREWTQLSPRIKVLSIADYNQDGILLVDIDGTLVVNLNDASPLGWGPFVKKTIRNYEVSVLLKLFGYGDVDMINFLGEDGNRIEPAAGLKSPVGRQVARFAEEFGVTHVIPFSSMHKYQRADSIWANQYVTPLEDYSIGFASSNCDILPAFSRYDCSRKEFEEINPAPTPAAVIEPKEFGDDWSQCLEAKEAQRVANYFKLISHLSGAMDFINIKVGGEDNIIELGDGHFNKGIQFEVPRRSLMRSIRYEIFDDLLIGNFMKTTLVGKWPASRLYPDFSPYVGKYADNGLAKSPEELSAYFEAYRRRDPVNYLRHRMERQAMFAVRSRIDSDSELYQVMKKTWLFVNQKMLR